MTEYKIEHDVPIPPVVKGRWRKLAFEMGAGSSVLFGSYAEAQMLAQALRALEHKVVRERQDSGEWRVWRVD